MGSRLWALGSGLWALGSGLWALGSGLWALGSGLWALGSGLWALGSGLWALGSRGEACCAGFPLVLLKPGNLWTRGRSPSSSPMAACSTLPSRPSLSTATGTLTDPTRGRFASRGPTSNKDDKAPPAGYSWIENKEPEAVDSWCDSDGCGTAALLRSVKWDPTKGAGSDPGSSPQQSGWKRTPTKQRGDIFASFVLRSGGDRFGRGGPPPPYQRRIGMIQEMMVMAKEGKQNEATELLKTLRQVRMKRRGLGTLTAAREEEQAVDMLWRLLDGRETPLSCGIATLGEMDVSIVGKLDLGMESTSLDDVLYRYASFRSLVDPITHDLIISLARYVHCPKTSKDMQHSHRPLTGRYGKGEEGCTAMPTPATAPEGDALCAMEKVCRQLTYHLSPHSRWRRQGLLKRKPQACLKALLSGPPTGGAVDLSGLPLGVRDVERLSGHLQRHSARVCSLELGFTELTDEAFLLLLPTLGALPRLETLALNGNRLTRAILRDLTDVLKDPASFPAVTWIDLGNNVDIFSLPQPFLLSLRKRCPKQGNLPTILEFGESQAGAGDDGTCVESLDELASDAERESRGLGAEEPVHPGNYETPGGGEKEMEKEDGAWGERERWGAEGEESGGGDGDDVPGKRNGEREEEVAEGKEEIPTCSFQPPCTVQSQESTGHTQPVGGQQVSDWGTSNQT
ncbi:hypothetical protein COCON_G00078280 [Conger conger]|uniref:Leucine rich repeat containing 75A n=1 Tax=Conger conger TaxID=82655 RepID=A0A9Q1DPV9_CONCO|nr:hypothetical protein COCON_G00078280 [Conger conger]